MISRSEEIWWDVDIEIFTVSRLEKNACITCVNLWYYFAKVQVVKDAFLRSVDALRNRSHEELHLLV